MNEKVIQFSRGNFEAAKAGLKMSDASLLFQVEEGQIFKGSFYIGNDMDVLMQGILYSDCPYLTLAREDLNDRELSIEYTFDATGLMAGETVNCNIHVITNCGETCIPVTASIDIPAVMYDGGRIKDLTGFAGLAREFPAAAVSIFKSHDFERVFLYRDTDNQILYNTLLKSSEPICAMEEFLVAKRKKNRVAISIDKNNYSYDNCFAVISDKVTVTKNTWGSVELVIRSDSDFIVPVHKRMWTDQFTGDSASLEFRIDPACMRDGINTGRIYISSVHQSLEINITAKKHTHNADTYFLRKKYYLGLMRLFIEFHNGKVSAPEFRARMDELLTCYRDVNEESRDMCEAYVAVVTSSNEMDEYVAAMRQRMAPDADDDTNIVIQYCIYLYIQAMECIVKGKAQEAAGIVEKIKNIYSEFTDHWFIFVLILKLDRGYGRSHKAFARMVEYIKKGCTSPLLYSEFCDRLKEDADLIHEWDDCMVLPLSWGAGRGYITEDMAVAYAYHLSRLRDFNKSSYRSLKILYDKYGNRELLQVICGMLIKGGVENEDALEWYAKGVNAQLRLTQLYEYYMLALPDSDERIIPHQVLMYFALDNRLSDREKAKLFAAVIRGKNVDEAAYKAYSIAIPNFARTQLLAGRIDSNLAVIYEDSLRLTSIDEVVAEALPGVMFRREIICSNPSMKSVCIVHKEIENEQIVPIVNGRAYVDIYTADAYIYVVDGKGNRYYQTEDYTVRKLLHMDSYADKCAEYSIEDDGLLLHMYSRCLKDYRNNEALITIRRMAHKRLQLRNHFRKNNMSALIYYYYEHADGERLDEMLDIIKLEESDRDTRSKWIELYIVRGKYIQALAALNRYGPGGVDEKKLGKLCEELVMCAPEKLADCGSSIEETLVSASYEFFARGGYSRDIVSYLVSRYNGASADMLEIWNVAHGLQIDTPEYNERLMERLLMVEANIKEGIPVLEAYMESGRDDTYKKAYISYIMYMYLRNEGITGTDITDHMWTFIKNKLMYEYNRTCLLGRLKYLGQTEDIGENDRIFCEVNLSKLYKSGIIMDFYKELERKLHTCIATADREMVQCNARPGIRMKLCCMFDNGVVQVMKVPEVHYGIYAAELVLFYGEHVKYEFYEEKNGKRITYESGALRHDINSDGTDGRLGMINDMIRSLEDKDYSALSDKMCAYIENEQTSKDLFVVL